MNKTVLKIENIRKSFAINYSGKKGLSGAEYKDVIKDLSLTLNRGEITAIIGGNGAGKTSLFNIVSGLLKADSGRIIYFGQEKNIECTSKAPWEIAAAGIGRLFQGTRVFGDLSILDHLIFQSNSAPLENPFYNVMRPGIARRNLVEIRQNLKMELGGIEEFSEILSNFNKPASSLSFARQRMLSLAALFVGEYDLFLLDEPSSGLNPDSFHVIYDILEKLRNNGKSVFLIEHNMDFVEKISNTCHFMAEGEIKYSGSTKEVLYMPEVRQSYLL